MNLYIFDDKLNVVSIVGKQFKSCLWSEGYNTVQSFTLELVASEHFKKTIRPNCFVWRQDRETIGVIKSVEIKDDVLIATGKQAVRVLDDIAFVGTIYPGDRIYFAISEAYYKTSQNPYISIKNKDVKDEYDHQISNKSMLSLITTMCQECDVGFSSKFLWTSNDPTIDIEVYKPTQNPNLIFSELIGNLSGISVSFSSENFKNYAIVLGAGEGDERKKVFVDKTNGGERYELIVDARDVQPEENETPEDYLARLESRGIEALLEKQNTLNCAFSVLADDFGKRFDLGDILTINLSDFGMQLIARVTRFSEKAQNNLSKVTIEVGNITIRRL